MLFKGVQVGGGSDNNEKYATYNSGGMVGGGTGERGGAVSRYSREDWISMMGNITSRADYTGRTPS